jgi:serine/threonine protein kinase
MTADRWAKIRDLVERAMALPPADRSAFLQAESADPDIAAEAAKLLTYDREASAMFAIEGWQQRAQRTAAEPSLAGTILGNYRLLEELGRGGMGAVYLAERADGVYQQKVALKVLQENIFTPALAERFRQERQILARLQHTGIARLLDGGVMPDGRPYLVLEYVDGKPIDQYCDEHHLDTDARLHLFLQVADVVQSAHQQLVLHLDLKPANILVTPKGDPQLLDFGIARILSEGEGGSRQTEATLRLLTPRYASPEQAEGTPLGVASDVFSLATLLYRLLTGSLPYPIEDASPLEAARIIREVLPSPPSHLAPPEIRPQLRGDIDTILLQALRKEPERRYPTIAAFAADVQRHLTSQPVLAHADSFSYRASKFFHRNRAAVIAASLVAFILAASAIAVVHSAIVARRERAVAERRLKDVRSLAHSYIFDLDPQLEQIPGTIGVRGFILKNGLNYLEAMSNETAGDDDLSREIAAGYNRVGRVQADMAMPSMGDSSSAWISMSKGIAIQQRLLDKNPSNVNERGALITQMNHLENVAVVDGDIVLADKMAHESWDLSQPLLAAGPAHRTFLNVFNVAWDIANDNAGNGDMWNFADPLAALPWLDRAHDIAERYKAGHPDEFLNPSVLGSYEREDVTRAQVLFAIGRGAEARSLYEDAIHLTTLTHNEIVEVQTRKVIQGDYLLYLLAMHDVRAAAALAPSLSIPEFEGKGEKRALTVDEADLLSVLSRVDLESGRTEPGRRKMKQSLDALETLHSDNPQSSEISSELAWDTYRLAEEPALETAIRREFYGRASELAAIYAGTHPQVLSAAMLVGRCNLGLAELARAAHNSTDQHTLAASSIAQFSKALAAHPIQPEASALLVRAKSLAAN